MDEGGYTRYDEKTARYIRVLSSCRPYWKTANLKELCKLLKNKYDGDARKLRTRGENAREQLQLKVKEFKGIGMFVVPVLC